MYGEKLTAPQEEFQPGEPVVVLYQGKHNGMAGKFVGIRPDPAWVDIEILPGIIRPQPLAWIRKIGYQGDRTGVV